MCYQCICLLTVRKWRRRGRPARTARSGRNVPAVRSGGARKWWRSTSAVKRRRGGTRYPAERTSGRQSAIFKRLRLSSGWGRGRFRRFRPAEADGVTVRPASRRVIWRRRGRSRRRPSKMKRPFLNTSSFRSTSATNKRRSVRLSSRRNCSIAECGFNCFAILLFFFCFVLCCRMWKRRQRCHRNLNNVRMGTNRLKVEWRRYPSASKRIQWPSMTPLS